MSTGSSSSRWSWSGARPCSTSCRNHVTCSSSRPHPSPAASSCRSTTRQRRTTEGRGAIGKFVANAIMSLDGYVAKQDHTIGRLFDWLQNGEVEIPTPAEDFTVHLTPASADHWR